MKAAVFHGRQDVRIEAVPDPPSPSSGELLLRVVRAGICGSDAAEYEHGPIVLDLERTHPVSGHCGPLVIGHEFVGVVEQVGDGTHFQVGDRVVTGAGVWCGGCDSCTAGRTNLCDRYYSIGVQVDGGLAEMALVPAHTCVRVPSTVSDDSAAMAQPLAIALHGLDRAGAVAADRVVVIGIGGVGSFVVVSAQRLGVHPLVAVDISAQRLETATALGATHVVNAAAEEVESAVMQATSGKGADLVVEASGAALGMAIATKVVRRGGRVLVLGHHSEPRAVDLGDLLLREVSLVTSVAHVCERDLPRALELLGQGDLAGRLVDRTIPLDALIERGLLPLIEKRATGKILVKP